MELVASTHAISADPEQAAILQLQRIQEIHDERGDNAGAAAVFRSVLDQTENRAVRNAAWSMLGNNLKDTGRIDEAVEALRQGLNENLEALD